MASLLFKIGKSRSHVDHWLACHGVPVATIELISVLGCSICGITSPVAWEGGCRLKRQGLQWCMCCTCNANQSLYL